MDERVEAQRREERWRRQVFQSQREEGIEVVEASDVPISREGLDSGSIEVVGVSDESVLNQSPSQASEFKSGARMTQVGQWFDGF